MKNDSLKVLVVLAAAMMLGSGCRQAKAPPTPPTPSVTAKQPVPREVMEWDEYPGRLEAVEMVEIRARVSGYLQSVHFKDGALVNKGDLLFVIDPRPYEAELARFEAALNQAETRLELAINDLGRAERLLKSRAISKRKLTPAARQNVKRRPACSLPRQHLRVQNSIWNTPGSPPPLRGASAAS
jgi:membrane fusion protein, multidrug efflux system